jgi:hypothetical protein
VTQVAVGTAVIASEQVRGGVRAVGEKTVDFVVGLLGKTRDQTGRRAEQAKNTLRSAIDAADRRGRQTIKGRPGAASLVDNSVNSAVTSAVNGAVAWAQVNVVPQLVAGALPEIKARVIPALINDLTNDPRMRELMLAQGNGAQSNGGPGQATDQLRTGAGRADDRFESTAHRVFGRNEKSGVAAKGPVSMKGPNEIRGA